MPRSIILSLPSEIIVPPQEAELLVIEVTMSVLRVGVEGGISCFFLQPAKEVRKNIGII